MLKEDIQINHKVIERFERLNELDRLAHAYLFVGPAYVGKGETALAIAKMIVGQTSIDIESGNHPDVHMIDNGYGEPIKIEQVRELIAQIKLRPYMAPKKIFILKNIENLTKEGANALLKTLEEPSVNSLLLLTTSVPERNLATVRSRCHLVHFTSMPTDQIASKLVEHFDESDQSAHFLSMLAEGCLGTAINLREQDAFQKKNEVIDRFILSRGDEDYIKTVLADKEVTKDFLDVLLSWVRDAMLIKVGVEDQRLINLDRISELNRFQQQYTFSELRKVNEEIISMCKMLSENLNIKIPVLIIKEQLNG